VAPLKKSVVFIPVRVPCHRCSRNTEQKQDSDPEHRVEKDGRKSEPDSPNRNSGKLTGQAVRDKPASRLLLSTVITAQGTPSGPAKPEAPSCALNPRCHFYPLLRSGDFRRAQQSSDEW